MTTTAMTTTVAAAATSRMSATVAALAADPLSGRRVGTPGGRVAAAWLAEQLRELGAHVTTSQFPVTGIRELSATPVLEWANRRLVHRRDFAEHLASADLPQPQTGPLVTDDAVAGAWLLADTATVDGAARAATAGAAGMVVPRGVDSAGWMPKMIAGPPTMPLPIIAVRTDLHQQMTSAARPGSGVLTASVPLRTITTTGTNVHGTLAEPASDAPSVLLVAHSDGVGDDPDQRLPGAADNASGVAAVLEAARQLTSKMPTGAGLAVAFLDAEEAGAQGSAHHAPTVPPGTYVINLDGAAALEDAASVEAGGPAHPLLAALDQAGRATGIPLSSIHSVLWTQ